jgi:outer membrane protein TolC
VGVSAPRLDAADDTTTPQTVPTLEAALRDARVRDPVIRRLLAEIRAQEARTRAISAGMRPDLSLTASVSLRAGGAPVGTTDQPGLGFVPMVPNFNVGILFNWPIFDATVLARARASQLAEDVLRAQLGVVRQQQVAAVQEAWLAVDEAQRALPSLQRALDAARANWEQADARFRSGLGNAVELADAEALRTQAEVDFALGQFQIARTRAQLSRVIAEGP